MSALEVGQLLPEKLATQLFLATAIFQVEDESMSMGCMCMFLHAQRSRFQIFVDAQGGRILDGRVIQLDTGPVATQHAGVDIPGVVFFVFGRHIASYATHSR